MSSPFTPRLGTNYCPKDEEVLEIKALLSEPTARLQRLDDEIADLQKAISRLAEEWESVNRFLEAHKALLSPFRRLPLDIIQEIFIACLPTHRNCVMNASEAPILLGRICASWRAISHLTPRLWARLHVAEPRLSHPGSSEKTTQRLEVTKMWLDRSGQCPLSISLHSGPDYYSPPGTPSAVPVVPSGQFLQALLPFAARWQDIQFTTCMLEDMTCLTPSDVPLLESITLHPLHRFPPHTMKWELFEMLRGPRIHSFSTMGNHFTPELQLQWHQLTDLAVLGAVWDSEMTSNIALQILSKCPKLRSCHLAINDRFTVDSPLLHAAVELESLSTLYLDFGNMVSLAPRLLNRLSLPGLRSFTLQGHGEPQEVFSLAPFFAQWTRLETLNIGGNTFSKPILLEILRSLPPTLRQLDIINITQGSASVDDDALTILVSCCPRLESLVIKFCTMISDEALLQFVLAKMTAESGAH
ncbi:hypothetical protein C8R47DRAFT_966979 [Mycena vitilis]|nr:hypothetical protein C8R47DRAFT_966979 [Mycena vitilis]